MSSRLISLTSSQRLTIVSRIPASKKETAWPYLALVPSAI